MEKYEIPIGHLPGHNQEPQKEYVVMDKKKNVKQLQGFGLEC